MLSLSSWQRAGNAKLPGMSEQPNILFITTDQQRFDTIAALGYDHMITPQLDWLCDEGIAFTRAYSSSPVCVPARATIMTGLHGDSTGCTSNKRDLKPLANHPTLPQLLTKAGYQTRAQGKMHFRPSRCHYGFEQMELEADYYRHMSKQGINVSRHGLALNQIAPGRASVPHGQSATEWVADRSIDFLETRDPTRPFFLWTSFEEPHPPFNPVKNLSTCIAVLTYLIPCEVIGPNR